MKINSVNLANIRPELLEVLKNLNIGDTVKGRLIEVLDKLVTVKTPGGQTFTAALMSDIPVSKGDFVELLINNINDTGIFAEIKPKKEASLDNNAKLTEILKQLDMPVNDKSMEAAKLLLKYNLPVNKESLANVLNLSKSMKNLEQGSVENKLGLLLSINDIKNTEVSTLSKISLLAEPEVREAVKQIVSTNEPQTEAIDIKAEAAVIDDESGEPAVKSEKTALKPQMTVEHKGAEEIQQKGANTINAKALVNDSAENRIKEDIRLSSKPNAEQIEQQLFKALQKLDIPVGSEAKTLIANAAKALAVISESSLEEAVYLLSKDIAVTPENLSLLKSNIRNENKLDEFLSRLEKQVQLHDNGEIKELKEEIKRIFVSPKQIENREEVAEKLKDIVKLGERIEAALKQESIIDPEIKNTLANLKENIDFMRNINQYNSYLQLPVLVNESKSTAELYVFKDKKKGKTIDPYNATILVALDLKNLGHLESLINVNKKAVNVTFRVEDKSIGDLIKASASMLQEALDVKGYTLSPIKVIKLEQSFSLLTLEEMINESSAERLHFDARI
ncbi:MAG: flagellar hook-length control protein FliK [Bacillota bacterium]